MKAWQIITHEASSPTYRRLKTPVPLARKSYYGSFKDSEEVRRAWQSTQEFAVALGAKIVLLQCPASFKPTKENKEAHGKFLGQAGPLPFRIAVEVRGEWRREDIQPFMNDYSIIHAIAPFVQSPARQAFIFYRLHGKGPSSNHFDYRYPPQDLAE